MKIVVVFSAPFPPQEGIGFHCVNLARELTNQGHHVTLVTRGAGLKTRESDHEGIRVIHAPFLPIYPVHVHLHGIFLANILKSVEADVFHFHSPLVPPISLKTPMVATFHTPMLADVRALEAIGPIAMLAKAQAPVSVQLERRLLRRAVVVTAVAQSVADELGEYGMTAGQVEIIGNGTDSSYFTPEGRLKPLVPTLLSAGRLAHRKGLLDLIEAFKLAHQVQPGIKLRIAGNGPLEQTLRQRVEAAGLESQVSFLGHLHSREALRQEYRQASAYVQASHYEGLPTVLLEAMSCAIPCLATAVSGHLDAIRHEHNGLLVEARNPEKLAQGMLRILTDQNADSWGQAGRETVEQKFSWPYLAQQYLRTYEQAIEHQNKKKTYHL